MNRAREVTRRAFLQTAGLGVAASFAAEAADPPKPGKLPHRVLGRTGVSVPILGLGTAQIGKFPEARDAQAQYHRCIDAGVTYIDTAPGFTGYANAQPYLAPVMKERRQELFVVTKCWEPEGDAALALLQKSLKEMGIERADLVYVHNIGDDRMPPEKVFAPNGVLKALEKARRDGLTRFLGVSGHSRPGRFDRYLDEWDFDVLMNAVSLVSRHIYDFENRVWPKAAAKNIALAAMKVYGGAVRGKNCRMPADLRAAALRYALGLPRVSLAVIGMTTPEELRENLALVRAFEPLSAAELKALEPRTRELAKEWANVYGPTS